MAAFFLSSLWFAASYAQLILPVTQTVQFTAAPVATGTGSATLIPFNVDLTGSEPNYRDADVIDKYYTSVWESKVAVFNDSERYGAFVSLRWPNGEGPVANAVGVNKKWNACVIAIPDLFSRVGVTSHGNSSCFDVVDIICLEVLLSQAAIAWEVAINQERTLTTEAYTRACRSIDSLLLVGNCFGPSSQEPAYIQTYPTLNPANGQPFILGVDDFETDKNKTQDTQRKALNRAWPLIVVEAEERISVAAAMSCPTAGIGFFSDNFQRANYDGWTVYGGEFSAGSKQLDSRGTAGSKAMINNLTVADFIYEADIFKPPTMNGGDVGLVFRVSDPAVGTNSYRGYYAGLDFGRKAVFLGRANNDWKELGRVPIEFAKLRANHVKVRAKGDSISVYVQDMEKPKITVKDDTYSSGLCGVRVDHTDVTFNNILIIRPPPEDLAPSVDGTCGGPSRYTCNGTEVFHGDCCGAQGLCGYSADDQPQYGLCDTIVTVTATSTPSTPTHDVIFDDFGHKEMTGWKIANGDFSAGSGELVIRHGDGAKAVLDKTFTNFVLEADLTITASTGNGGLLFRASSLVPGGAPDAYTGYYVGLGANGWVDLGRADGWWHDIQPVRYDVAVGKKYHIKVRAVGDQIDVYVDDMYTRLISVRDGTVAMGSVGLRVYNTGMKVNNFKVLQL